MVPGPCLRFLFSARRAFSSSTTLSPISSFVAGALPRAEPLIHSTSFCSSACVSTSVAHRNPSRHLILSVSALLSTLTDTPGNSLVLRVFLAP